MRTKQTQKQKQPLKMRLPEEVLNEMARRILGMSPKPHITLSDDVISYYRELSLASNIRYDMYTGTYKYDTGRD